MRKYALLTGLGVVLAGALATEASAVPSFTRMTGMTCNQCHVSFSPVPTFTFTGKKFRLNGYRAPHVAQKMEAGEEGALNGKRLQIGLTDYFSFRFGSTLLAQSRGTWDPEAGTPPPSSSLSTNPYNNAAIFFVGPIGDHIGIWNEFYFSTAGSNTQTFRVIAYDEYDVKFVMNTENSILGMNLSTQSLNQTLGFGPFPTGLTSHMQRGGTAQAHTPYGNLSVYGFFNDRFAVTAGIQAGEDNLNYSCTDKNANGQRDDGICMAYQGMVAYALKNSDENELWVNAFVKVGNDAVPIVTNTEIRADRSAFDYVDAIAGVSATRTNLPLASRTAYRAADIGDIFRSYYEIFWGAIDRGPHSVATTIRFNLNNEEYADQSKVTHNAIGFGGRYMYDRTWGLNVAIEDDLKYEFTSVDGTEYDVPRTVGFTTTLSYRPAMNFSVNLTGGNSRATRLVGAAPGAFDQRFNNGWSWNLGIDYMF
jgi:hypothetical protein